jgi:CRISPR-associated RAMP protein (TIGR02581 family)
MEALRERYPDDPVKLAQAIGENSCYVCRVFGSPWLASKALFKDLTLEHPEFWFEGGYQVRAGVGIERDSGAAQEGVLYSSELVPPGTRFRWEITVENADPVMEEPLLFLALREMVHAHIPMGGGRSRGLGRVSLCVDAATVVDKEGLKAYLISGEPTELNWDTLVARIPPMIQALTEQEAADA